jgi:hypothetical protein
MLEDNFSSINKAKVPVELKSASFFLTEELVGFIISYMHVHPNVDVETCYMAFGILKEAMRRGLVNRITKAGIKGMEVEFVEELYKSIQDEQNLASADENMKGEK